MKPNEKSPEIEDMLTNVFGVDRRGSIKNNACVSCGQPANKFKDEISRREFTISGFCQSCQDSVFG